MDRWTNKQTTKNVYFFQVEVVTNPPIWLGLSLVQIFLHVSLPTVMVTQVQCVCEKGQQVIWEKEKKVKIISYILVSLRAEKLHFSRPQSQILNVQTFQPAKNVLIYYFFLKHDAYHTDFRMDANGVTPIPAPIHIITLYLNTSCKKTTLNIATVVLICMYRTTKPITTSIYLLEQKCMAINSRKTVGSITSHCSGNEPPQQMTWETGGNWA